MLRRIAIASVLWASCCSFASGAGEQWVQVSSPHFTVITDSSDKQGRHILDQFERMRWLFQTLFPKIKVDPPLPIVVIAVKNAKEFQAIEPAVYLSKEQVSLSGFF
jgi:hypothetical protein